jgi:hypothetical protein
MPHFFVRTSKRTAVSAPMPWFFLAPLFWLAILWPLVLLRFAVWCLSDLAPVVRWGLIIAFLTVCFILGASRHK